MTDESSDAALRAAALLEHSKGDHGFLTHPFCAACQHVLEERVLSRQVDCPPGFIASEEWLRPFDWGGTRPLPTPDAPPCSGAGQIAGSLFGVLKCPQCDHYWRYPGPSTWTLEPRTVYLPAFRVPPHGQVYKPRKEGGEASGEEEVEAQDEADADLK